MTGRWLVLVGIAAATLASPPDAAARKKRALCPDARFLVHERPLLLTNPALAVDGLTFMRDAHMLGVESGCPLNPVKIKAVKKGTRVRGRWTNCNGVTGRVRLKATIDRTCGTMRGKLRAKRANLKRNFVATLSRCGDAIVDREGGEQCDVVGTGCGFGQACSASCTCGPGGPPTTTTTLPNTDLTVTSVNVDGHTGEAGATVVVHGTIVNKGPGTVPGPWVDAVYFSRDELFSRDDRRIAEFTQTLPLAPGESYDFEYEVTLPEVPTGDYYLVVRTDDKNQLLEINEQNNTLSTNVHITAANLVPTQLQDQPDRENPRHLTVSWTVLNDGEAPARPPWKDYLYISLDERLDASDVLIWPSGDVIVAPIVDPHERYEVSVEVTLPPTIVAGSYHLILSADAADEIFEDSEDDNFVTEPIRVD